MRIFTSKKRDVVVLKQGDAKILKRDVKDNARYKDLLDAWTYHSWLRAALSVVGRSLMGPGFDIEPVEGFRHSALQKKKIWSFLNSYGSGNWDSIKDYYTPAAKLYVTAILIKLLGRSGWEIIRGENGKAMGYDVIFGQVNPNVDDTGRFKRGEPAFTQQFGSTTHNFDNSQDIVYFLWPDADGSVTGGTDIESLVELVIPADLYAQSAYRNLHRNQSTPDGIWITDPGMDDDTYAAVVAQIDAKYQGQDNYGRAFITAKGDVDFKPIAQSRDDAPYLDGREMSRHETSAVTGVPGAKMGLTSEMSRAGLREVQRYFHESTMAPLFRFMEEVLYNQICIREFNAPGWRVKFKPPDFLTGMEKATIAQRYWGTGSLSPNEIRRGYLGLDSRDGGDGYYVPANVSGGAALSQPGSAARAGADDSGLPTADYVGDEEKPLRADKMLKELRDWRKVEKRIRQGKRFQKEFECHEIPSRMAQGVKIVLELAETVEEVSEVFAELIEEIETWKDLEL